MLSTSGPVYNTHAAGNAQISNTNGNIINGNVYMLSTDEGNGDAISSSFKSTYTARDNLEDKIYRWLDAPDSSGNFHAAREKHHEQTGTWFIEGEDYFRWKETPASALWVYGTRESCRALRKNHL
ncbi:hypothetical protein FIBSPDRAFT_556517 [Athelia psychrophila]|uniref:Uncharacterized protein n=1 Tax=Athelia psychrophila TaxID=1759441 RepID=A0A166ICN6_9AGAM|nr:hypothetical protein FIBSPDRAFT_556517 [Fibularhizoctonia sp. CBS 109695]